MRIFWAVMCGAIVTVYGAAGVLLRFVAGGDARVEQTLCRYLSYCDDEVPRAEVHVGLWSGNPDLEASAIQEARELLRRSPASAERWCTLGDAYLRTGEIGHARYAYTQALERGPNSPPILMRAAHFEWVLGNTAGYLRHTGRVLALVPDYDAVIFDGCRRVGVDAGQVIAAGLAANPNLAARYSAYLSARGGPSDTR
jgi:tetratricopeptide (TPR) repeat protein